PGVINNCEGCHTSEQYNLPQQANTRPSLASTQVGTDGAGDPIMEPRFFSPALVACGSCHLESALGLVDPNNPIPGDAIIGHMEKNGAVFAAETAEEATGTEQCSTCHAVGQEQGVDKVHKVYDYR
ncbi:multiheme c-type cytochrome, partial [Vibrio sp.]|uniref:multiheme c-type cytochrome n=1 Tax=Vibrio sp. TaxID=678 RepID=UPI003D0CCCFE